MNIELETFNLVRYNELKHKNLINEFKNGISYSEFIHDIDRRLQISKNSKNIYQSAFVVECNDIVIGYLYISNMRNDEVFLEYSILKEHRRKGYGSKLINEVTNYLFEKQNIKCTKLDIDPSNKNSVFLADSCGYSFDEEEYESRNYTGRMQFVKENDCYISKRRKM